MTFHCPAGIDIMDLILCSTPDSHYSHRKLPPQLIRPEAEPETRAWEVIPGCRSEGVGSDRQGGGKASMYMCQIPTSLLREGMANMLRGCPGEGEEPGTPTKGSCPSLVKGAQRPPSLTLKMSLG